MWLAQPLAEDSGCSDCRLSGKHRLGMWGQPGWKIRLCRTLGGRGIGLGLYSGQSSLNLAQYLHSTSKLSAIPESHSACWTLPISQLFSVTASGPMSESHCVLGVLAAQSRETKVGNVSKAVPHFQTQSPRGSQPGSKGYWGS